MDKKLFFICFGLLLLTFGCRKEQIFVSNTVDLQFSADTIFLDTVFTTIGSSTRALKVKNPTSDNLLITNVRLGNGSSSFYRMNVNGTSTKNMSDVEILANDSIYIFIEVTADVGGATSLLYTDSIIFTTAGNVQNVQLVTLAKDAYFYLPNAVLNIPNDPFSPIQVPYRRLDCDDVWSNDKPHVVYGYGLVPENCSLTILPGTEVHFHAGSGLLIDEGAQLLIDPNEAGDVESNPVVLQGDRLEPDYENIAGQWGGLFGGIFFVRGSTGNVINSAIIKNSNIALRVDSTDAANQNLKIKNSYVMNNSRVGIYGGFANIQAENVVLANNGLYSFFALGGNYNFLHCTFANYWNSSSRNTPSIGLTNFFENANGDNDIREIENAYFGNCIVYGNNRSEFGVAKLEGGDLNYKFANGLMRLDKDPDDNSYDVQDPNLFLDCIFNSDPNFMDEYSYDYQLDTLSPAMDVGNTVDGALVPFDILKLSRDFNGLPDLGAYERYE